MSRVSINNEVENIIRILAENPRLSIREVANRTGLKYQYVRRKVQSLVSRRLVSFGILVSSSLLGREVSIIKIKGRNVDRLLERLSKCTRVIMAFKSNHEEITMIFVSKNKEDSALFLDIVRALNSEIKEIYVENGVLDSNVYIPLKHGKLDCNVSDKCLKCLLGLKQ